MTMRLVMAWEEEEEGELEEWEQEWEGLESETVNWGRDGF